MTIALLFASAAPGGALSAILHERELTLGMMLVALSIAFALGAAHALTPGHGKTLVAAYLVGSRGTIKHAAYLGAMVTFTHTVSVFALGLATMFLFRYVMPQNITQWLGVVSGLSIMAIGGWMIRRRWRLARHHHDHDRHHDHHHHHDHSHVPDDLSWRGLTALAVSGGLAPCESALILLLSAIALGRVGLGLVLLIAFSLGLALVLASIGMLVLFARHLLPERTRVHSGVVRWAPLAAGAVVIVTGALMTAVSLGWMQPHWMLG